MKFKELKKIINEVDEEKYGEREIYIQSDEEGNNFYKLRGLDFDAFFNGEIPSSDEYWQDDYDTYEEFLLYNEPCGVLYP